LVYTNIRGMIRFVLCLILLNTAWTNAIPTKDGSNVHTLANALRSAAKLSTYWLEKGKSLAKNPFFSKTLHAGNSAKTQLAQRSPVRFQQEEQTQSKKTQSRAEDTDYSGYNLPKLCPWCDVTIEEYSGTPSEKGHPKPHRHTCLPPGSPCSSFEKDRCCGRKCCGFMDGRLEQGLCGDPSNEDQCSDMTKNDSSSGEDDSKPKKGSHRFRHGKKGKKGKKAKKVSKRKNAGIQKLEPEAQKVPAHVKEKAEGKKIVNEKPMMKIVNGEEVKPPHSLPWQAAMVESRNNKTSVGTSKIAGANCGGTIICPKFVMTAAHCVTEENSNPFKPLKEKNFKIVVGAHNLEEAEDSRELHEIKKFHIHPKWVPLADHDFAIIELKKIINMKKESMAVYLPEPKDKTFTGASLVVSGWGNTVDNENGKKDGKASNVLMVTSVPYVSDSECKSIYQPVEEIPDSITDVSMCAGEIDKMDTDACQGDSGGPLTWLDEDTGHVKLVGVVSIGNGCANKGWPGLYAKVTYVLKWIKKIIGNCNKDTCGYDFCMDKDHLKSAQRHFDKKTF